MIRPMLASLVDAPLDDPDYVYEPKYDGIRTIADVSPHPPAARLWSRLGNEKSAQFPEIVAALRTWARRLPDRVVVDGEIVALDERGEPAGFQRLQGRIHLADAQPPSDRVAFIAFDLLRQGADDLRGRPLVERRAALERLMKGRAVSHLRLSEVARDGRALYARALAQGWEGLIAKRARSPYRSGKRSPDWRKLKIVHEQEFVVGGWTEPRRSREYFGALLLGVYPPRRGAKAGALEYVGHTGTGFDEAELARVMGRLRPLETRESPFHVRPRPNERPHWVEPALVAQVKFTEWTDDGKLRHPVYLGLRDDKDPRDVHREEHSRLNAGTTARLAPVSRGAGRGSSNDAAPPPPPDGLMGKLRALEDARRDGTVTLPGGGRLSVTNLHKLFWPGAKLTKGDLIRYYAQVAPAILPVVADRPLVMKRQPDGIAGKPFYQQRAPDRVPAGVRVETVAADREVPRRLIGGDLTTLLYMAQLGAISQDPWFSRLGSPLAADHAAFDLDPAPGVPFARVLDVARWLRDELEWLGAAGFPKTSGADGLHIYVPLPPETPYEAGLLFCRILATVVADRHPKVATIERSVRARGRRVYIDYLQNIVGKTLASAYSARASEDAGVSTPLAWREVDAGVSREAFTIRTVPDRLRDVGDLWKGLRDSPGVDLSSALRYQRARPARRRSGARSSRRS